MRGGLQAGMKGWRGVRLSFWHVQELEEKRLSYSDNEEGAEKWYMGLGQVEARVTELERYQQVWLYTSHHAVAALHAYIACSVPGFWRYPFVKALKGHRKFRFYNVYLRLWHGSAWHAHIRGAGCRLQLQMDDWRTCYSGRN